VLFQPIDDKTQCIGVYANGSLIFDESEIPKNLTKTWGYTGSLKEKDVQYANIYAHGKAIEEVCPEHLRDEWDAAAKKMRAYKKSFDIAKINLREHCFFDLVPYDALIQFCEIKNQITEHVFENYEKPANYEYMASAAKLLHKIKYQDLKVDASECRNLFINGGMRNESQKILNGSKHVHYNLFGTVTGRLSTHPRSFPMLTMKRELRRLIKPHNDWFLSLDYNGAEVRTLLALSEQKQPKGDIHKWNITNVFQNTGMNREEAKTSFFAWLYNPDSDHIKTNYYDRKKVLDKYYDGEYINTVFGRHIKVSNWKAFNYLIQSTTADLVIDRAVAIERILEGRKSFISHIVHDEIVIDFADQEREMVGQIRDMFAKNKLDTFKVNLKAGKNYYDLENLSL
jgi:hypothetical protein